MGKLNIAHHKSYHPYRRDNIERVRQDEEEARLKEEREEGRMRMADAEARIELLRQRAGLKKGKKKEKEGDDIDSAMREQVATSTSTPVVPDSLQTPEGHINLFASLEAASATQSPDATLALIRKQAKDHPVDKGKGKGKAEDEGVRLAPSKLDLKPWYTDEELRSAKDREQGVHERESRRAKDLSRKANGDPLREVKEQLARRARERETPQEGVWARWGGRSKPPTASTTIGSAQSDDPAVAARLSRESAERQRAQALIERKRREAAAAAGVSPEVGSVQSTPRAGYRDVYNAQALREVEAARKERTERVERWQRDERDRDRDRGWERDRKKERERYWRGDDEGRRREVEVGRTRERSW